VNIRHSLISVTGVIASQGTSFLSIIMIGKFCGPDELGDFSYLTAIGLFLGSVIGLRMEMACMATDRRAAASAVVSSSAVALVIATVLTVATVAAGHWRYLPSIALALGVFFQQALSLALASDRAYTRIAFVRAVPNGAFLIFVAMWILMLTGECRDISVSTVYGAIFLALTLFPLCHYIARAMPALKGEVTLLSESQISYARYALPITILNSVVIYATAIIMPLVFKREDAGIFALAYRIGYFAASLLSQSLGPIFRRDLMDYRAGRFGVQKNPAVAFTVLLAVVSSIMVLVSYIGLRVVVDFQMGKVWEASKSVYLLLVPYFVLMAIFGSVAQVFIVFDRQRIDLILQSANVALIFAVFGAVQVLRIDFMQAVALLSMASSAVACIGVYWAIKVAGEQKARLECVSSGYQG